jgi:hypothetical protein
LIRSVLDGNQSLIETHLPFCHPERTRISYFTALTIATFVVLPKENHMQLTEPATLDRKSGVAEGSAVSSLGHRRLRNFDNQALVAVKVAAPYSPSFTSPVNWLPATTPVKMKGTS